ATRPAGPGPATAGTASPEGQIDRRPDQLAIRQPVAGEGPLLRRLGRLGGGGRRFGGTGLALATGPGDGGSLHPLDLEFQHLAAIGLQDLELEIPQPLHHLARRRHMAGEVEYEAPDGVDLIGEFTHVEVGTECGAHLGQFGAGAGDVGAGVELADKGRIVGVVLVLDVADHRLEQVFDGYDAIGAAVFVDDDGHMHPLQLHLPQKVADRHGGRHEQHVAHHFELADVGAQPRAHHLDARFLDRIIERRHFDDASQRVLDVDEAGDVVEIVVIDGNARVPRLEEARQQGAQRLVDIYGDDVGARHHDVVDAHVAELQDIVQDGALGIGKIRAFGAALTLEQHLEIVADRGSPQGEERLEALPQTRPPRRGGGGTRGWFGIG